MSFTCVNGVRHKLGTSHRARSVACWACDSRTRQAACAHEGPPIPRWAGILGWRYHCSSCDAQVVAPSDAQSAEDG